MTQQLTFSAGIHSATETLKYNHEIIDYCIILKNNNRLEQCVNIIQQHKIKIISTIPQDIAAQLMEINHQGIIVVHKEKSQPQELISWAEKHQQNLRLIILDGVQDPRNLGACIRTACAANCHGIVIPKNHNASVNNPTTQKVASGACAILPIFEVTNINRTILQLKKLGIWCFGFSERGEESVFKTDLSGPCALIFGTEATGLKSSTIKNCDHLVKIPSNDNFPSLNLSVSVGIGAFELLRQTKASEKI